jgi:hypothetical protein
MRTKLQRLAQERNWKRARICQAVTTIEEFSRQYIGRGYSGTIQDFKRVLLDAIDRDWKVEQALATLAKHR